MDNDDGWYHQQLLERRRQEEEFQTDPEWLAEMKRRAAYNARWWQWAIQGK